MIILFFFPPLESLDFLSHPDVGCFLLPAGPVGIQDRANGSKLASCLGFVRVRATLKSKRPTSPLDRPAQASDPSGPFSGEGATGSSLRGGLPRSTCSRLPWLGSSRRAPEVAEVRRLEEVVDADQGEHDQGADHRAQLLDCSVPHQGTAAVASQDHAQHHLDVTGEPGNEYPGDDLLAQKGGQSLGLGEAPSRGLPYSRSIQMQGLDWTLIRPPKATGSCDSFIP